MTKLKQYISELALKSKDVTIEKVKEAPDKREYTVTVSGIKFILIFEAGMITGKRYNSFYLKDDAVEWANQDRQIKIWEIEFFDDEMDMDTSPKTPGVAIKLFAAIQKLTEKFIIEEHPAIIEFYPSDDNRGRLKLYKTLAKKIERKHKDYQAVYASFVGGWLVIRKDKIKGGEL